MSQPDTHAAEYDYIAFDPRDFQMNPTAASSTAQGTHFGGREFWQSGGREHGQLREHREGQGQGHGHGHGLSSRDGRDPQSFYHTPSASMPSTSLSSILGAAGAEGRPGNGLAGGHHGQHAQRIFGPNGLADGWGSPSATGAPAVNSHPRHPLPSLSQSIPGQQHQQHQHHPHQQLPPVSQKLVLNHHHHHHRASPPRPPPFAPTSAPAAFTQSDRDSLRDAFLARQFHQASPPSSVPTSAQVASLPSPSSATPPRSTLWWGELEPWMDEEYAKQVCNLMGWDPVSIKVPRPAPDPLTGRQANNPGYCFLTFPSQVHAAAVLQQVNSTNNGNPLTMPNSNKPFNMNWASSVPTAPLSVPFNAPTVSIPGAQNPNYPKEYSIFVGDLAPEVSNSDLVAVFRNPVLGLRNDREPRFIRPFLSCKSAKIMLDPVTGVSRGYGFVRFGDEADQQRALIEMHGLYCLSRPMRISPATAKFKPVPGVNMDFSQMQYPSPYSSLPDPQQLSLALPAPTGTKSVSTPLASAGGNNGPGLGNLSGPNSFSAPSLNSASSMASSATLASTPSEDALKSLPNSNSSSSPASANSAVPSSISAALAQQTHDQLMAQRYNIPEESWKHHAQARAILSNLIGPNGEQLTSSDPYNTTVFVGGLSPLISEETLRTFFAPFGEIHYVKVPVGKHCGFVQFVRKPDAERAIEKMQGFPIGGSRIRLSWGRSQYKAAQAAAQAAQAAALQAQYQQVQLPPQNPPQLTPEQALQLLEKFGITQFLNNGSQIPNANLEALQAVQQRGEQHPQQPPQQQQQQQSLGQFDVFGPSSFEPGSSYGSSFSPFSPDPNYLGENLGRENNVSVSPGQSQSFSSTSSKGYAPWYSSTPQDEKVSGSGSSGKASPTGPAASSRPSSARPFSTFLGDAQPNRSTSRQEGAVSRPEVPRRPSQGMDHFVPTRDREHDPIHDLNGTLASLNLDNQGSWKSGNENSLQASS